MKTIELLENTSTDPKGEWLLPDGYVLAFDTSMTGGAYRYIIYLLLEDDTPVAQAIISKSVTRVHQMLWTFTLLPDVAQMESAYLDRVEGFNMLKFKWWITNQLITAGLIKAQRNVGVDNAI